MNQTNFLIGRGELLTHDIKGPKRMPNKAEAYTFDEAVARLVPQFTSAAEALDALPSEACPGDFGVARLTINPSYIAKSYFPSSFLRTVGLESVGSRTVKTTPQKWTKTSAPTECTTTELFIAGKRQAFRNLPAWTKDLSSSTQEALDLAHIERFAPFNSQERIVDAGNGNERFFEVGLHLLPDEDPKIIQSSFVAFVNGLDGKVHVDLGFTAGTLWFVPVECNSATLADLAKFSFVRVIRPIPKLRGLRPLQRITGTTIGCQLPAEQPLSSEPKVAILDGGLPEQHVTFPWVRHYRESDPSSNADPDNEEHGLAVTSSFSSDQFSQTGSRHAHFPTWIIIGCLTISPRKRIRWNYIAR